MERARLRERWASALWSERARSVPTLISVLLAIAVVAEAARVSFAVHDDLRGPRLQTMPGPGAAARDFDPQAVIRSHLFGAALEDRRPPNASVVSSIPSVLSGIIAVTDPARGSAIIAVNGAPAHWYVAGSDLPDGARLSQVFPAYVLLQRGVATELLRLPSKLAPGAAAVSMLAAATGPRAGESLGDFGLPAVTKNPREFSSIRRWFNGFLGREAPSPDGQFHGLLVRPMPRYRREYDVHDGDVIKAINGVPLEDPDTAGQVLQQARGASVSVTVIRKEGTVDELTLKVGS